MQTRHNVCWSRRTKAMIIKPRRSFIDPNRQASWANFVTQSEDSLRRYRQPHPRPNQMREPNRFSRDIRDLTSTTQNPQHYSQDDTPRNTFAEIRPLQYANDSTLR